MTNINSTKLRRDLFNYLDQAVTYNDTITVTTKNGNAIIISEEDYSSLMETVYLLNAKGMKDRFIEALNTKPEECDEFKW